MTTLLYAGGGRYLLGIPAADLSDADLARVAWSRLADRPETPADIDPALVDALREELVETGLYAKPKPKKESPA